MWSLFNYKKIKCSDIAEVFFVISSLSNLGDKLGNNIISWFILTIELNY